VDREELSQANRRIVSRLGLVVLAMFGFGFALVPLYDVFCEVTGLNGKTGRIGIEEALSGQVDEARETVTCPGRSNPWSGGSRSTPAR
jgi:cytochrome c oxidase assembly protein subunit 11